MCGSNPSMAEAAALASGMRPGREQGRFGIIMLNLPTMSFACVASAHSHTVRLRDRYRPEGRRTTVELNYVKTGRHCETRLCGRSQHQSMINAEWPLPHVAFSRLYKT